MATAYSPQAAQQFIQAYGPQPVMGGPFDVPGWFGGTVATLSDYVRLRYPSYGVIVRPPGNGFREILVWYDASSVLHVIDVTREPISADVQKAPLSAPSFASIVAERVAEVAAQVEAGLPTPAQALGSMALIAASVAVVMIATRK